MNLACATLMKAFKDDGLLVHGPIEEHEFSAFMICKKWPVNTCVLVFVNDAEVSATLYVGDPRKYFLKPYLAGDFFSFLYKKKSSELWCIKTPIVDPTLKEGLDKIIAAL